MKGRTNDDAVSRFDQRLGGMQTKAGIATYIRPRKK
jgi:hypothetical protein